MPKHHASKLFHLTMGISNSHHLLFVDPGLAGTGWAYFTSLPGNPESHGEIKTPYSYKGDDWWKRAEYMGRDLNTIMERKPNPTAVVIEMPETWAGNETSVTATKRGDISKLAFLVGVFAALASEQGADVILVSPNDWKGNLPKEVVAARCLTAFGFQVTSTHTQDAIGMGLSAQGAL